jgi:hypothetical protein
LILVAGDDARGRERFAGDSGEKVCIAMSIG